MATKKTSKKSTKKSAPKLVPMERDGQKADVHPNEVENFERAGWSKK